MLLLLPVALPVRPCTVIFENDGVLRGELRARVTVMVLSWPGLLVDWPMLTLKSDRAWTKSGTASPAIENECQLLATFASIQVVAIHSPRDTAFERAQRRDGERRF